MLSTLKSLSIDGISLKKLYVDGVLAWCAKSLPDEYQEVEWIAAATNVGAYIDLGFAFDTKAKVYMSQWIPSNSTVTGYPFGAAENSGALRFCFTSPYGSYSYLYGSNGTEYIQSGVSISLEGKNEFVFAAEAGNLTIENTTSGKFFVETNQGSYTMTNNLYLFAQNYNGTARFGNERKIGYFKYYDKNDELICDLIPCYRKSDGVIGMYDLVRKTFLTNVGSGTFTKPLIVNFTNQVPISIDTDGSIYNGVGYKEGYRVRSGGAEIEVAEGTITGYIPVNGGDEIRVSGTDFFVASSENAINVSDSSFTNLGQLAGNAANGYGIINSTYPSYNFSSIVEESAGVYKWIVPPAESGIAYIRVTAKTLNGESLIVTVNEAII